ncbi:MAG TPA: hypothetical protein VN375_19710 [Vicinamibacteria bacterium]|jgi:hypothetical protein|nr:hypothetical protein [Vicinamibacteria bacterium]
MISSLGLARTRVVLLLAASLSALSEPGDAAATSYTGGRMTTYLSLLLLLGLGVPAPAAALQFDSFHRVGIH